MELTGIVIAALEPRSGVSKQGNAWKTQEYVIETQDQYPKRMCFELYGEDKIQQANIQVGEQLKVSFDVDAREWNGRWFNSVRAWKIERVGAQDMQPAQQQSASPQYVGSVPENFPPDNGKNDLPF